MKLLIFHLDGVLGGRSLLFPERTRVIRIGRDPWFCHVSVPFDGGVVAAVHCSIRNTTRDGPRLRLRGAPVFVNGVPAVDGQRLGRLTWMQLGHDGPRLLVRAIHDGLGLGAVARPTPASPRLGLAAAAAA